MLTNLLVLTAMKEEERSLRELLASVPSAAASYGKSIRVSVIEYKLGGRIVTLARSGIGAVNAAVALATLSEHRPIDAVILFGVGGSIVADLRIGDLVVSKKVLQHNYFSSLDFGNPRMVPGDIIFTKKDTEGYSAAIPADRGLIDLVAGTLPCGRAKVGTVVSGNEFVGTSKRKLELQSLDPEALLVDMEAAGVAQIARKIGLPFVVVKTVADRLHANGSIENDFKTCLESAAKNTAVVLHRVLQS